MIIQQWKKQLWVTLLPWKKCSWKFNMNPQTEKSSIFLYSKLIKPKLNKSLKVKTISRRLVFQTWEISMYLSVMYQYYSSKNVSNFEKTMLCLDNKHEKFINSWTVFFQLCKKWVFFLVWNVSLSLKCDPFEMWVQWLYTCRDMCWF